MTDRPTLPASGGSYTRTEDGALERTAATTEEAPVPSRKPSRKRSSS